MFTPDQLRMFLRSLVNLDPYNFAGDVADFFVGDNENNQQTAEEVLSSAIVALPDGKLTEFALRLVLTGHKDIPTESEFDFLMQAEAVFNPPQPKKQPSAKKPQAESEDKIKAKKKAPPKRQNAA